MLNKKKSGKSLILLTIVICFMSFALVFVSRIFYNKGDNKTQEEAFKRNVYEYYLEVEDYKVQLAQTEGFVENEFNVCGTALRNVIPNIIETDMPKFKIEQGKLIYIGNNEQEKQWTKEVRI